MFLFFKYQFLRDLEDEIYAAKMEEANLKRKLNGKLTAATMPDLDETNLTLTIL